jgi:MFS family permease
VFLLANASLSAVLVPFGIERLGGAEQVGLVVSALGVGFLLGAGLVRPLVDRVQPRHLLAAAQLATAGGFAALFSATDLTVALPAAVAIGLFGSMTMVVPQTAIQRVVPDAVLGRVGAVFLAGEALATLVGSVAGPALAEGVSLAATATAACALTAVGALVGAVLVPVSPRLVVRPPGHPDG